MNIKRYLNRINYSGSLIPSIEVLNELQSAHLFNVPFENLDIHNKVKIDLLNTYDKIVDRCRGGFCYELNGLFYGLLKEAGFDVKMVSARVYNEEGTFGAEFDHMALIVKINNDKYLADVGFGDFSFHPLKITFNTVIEDRCGKFIFEEYDSNYFIIKKLNDKNEFVPGYIFSEKKRTQDEFYEMCIYHQTSPASHFTRNIVCSKLTQNGRITISGNKLKITNDGVATEQYLTSDEELLIKLKDLFGIVLDRI